MNDDDYAAALRQELDSLIRECEEARAARNKGRLLVEHLKAEQTSLQAQKDQRLLRIRLLNELDFLQRQAEDKKLEKIEAVTRLVAAQQQYNQLLARAGRCLPEAVQAQQQLLQEPETTEEEKTQTQRKSKSHFRQQKKEAVAPQQQNFELYNRSISSEVRTKSVRSHAASPRSLEENNARQKERPQSNMPEESKKVNTKDSSRDQRVEGSSGETRNPKPERSTKTTRQTPSGQQRQQQQQQRREASTDDMSAVTEEEQYRHYTHDGSKPIISSALLNDQMNENEKKDLANFMSACGYHSPSENE